MIDNKSLRNLYLERFMKFLKYNIFNLSEIIMQTESFNVIVNRLHEYIICL